MHILDVENVDVKLSGEPQVRSVQLRRNDLKEQVSIEAKAFKRVKKRSVVNPKSKQFTLQHSRFKLPKAAEVTETMAAASKDLSERASHAGFETPEVKPNLTRSNRMTSHKKTRARQELLDKKLSMEDGETIEVLRAVEATIEEAEEEKSARNIPHQNLETRQQSPVTLSNEVDLKSPNEEAKSQMVEAESANVEPREDRVLAEVKSAEIDPTSESSVNTTKA